MFHNKVTLLKHNKGTFVIKSYKILLGLLIAISLSSSSNAVYPSVDKDGNQVLRADEDRHIICSMGHLADYADVQRDAWEIAADEKAEREGKRIVFPPKADKNPKPAPLKNDRPIKVKVGKKHPKVSLQAKQAKQKAQKTPGSEKNWLSQQFDKHPIATVFAGTGIAVTAGMLIDFAIRGTDSWLYKTYKTLFETVDLKPTTEIQ